MILTARLAALLALLSTLAVPVATRANAPGIAGQDDRRVLAEATPTSNAIGRVNRASGGFCTGILIAPAQVLTTAQCAWDQQHHRLLPPDMLHFVAGYRHASYLAHARAKAIRTDPRLVMSPSGVPQSLVLDWAVLELEKPVAKPGEIRPIPIAGPEERKGIVGRPVLTRIGYGWDRPYLPVVVQSCSALALAGGGQILLHDCDATTGDPGSAILIRDKDGYALLGMEVAVVEHDNKPVDAAILMTRVVPADVLR